MLQATAATWSLWPTSVRSSRRPSASQRRTLRSAPPLAISRPSGLQATLSTRSLCPSRQATLEPSSAASLGVLALAFSAITPGFPLAFALVAGLGIAVAMAHAWIVSALGTADLVRDEFVVQIIVVLMTATGIAVVVRVAIEAEERTRRLVARGRRRIDDLERVERVVRRFDGSRSVRDVIQSVDGIGVTTVAGFQQVAQSRKPGTDVTLELVRRGEALKVAVPVVESGTSGTTRDGSGVVLRTVAGIGCEVVALAPGSPAARAGLRRGDLIVALDGRPAPDAARLQRALSASDPARAVLLTIRRDLQHHVIAVEPR